jgi:hypothetical protein
LDSLTQSNPAARPLVRVPPDRGSHSLVQDAVITGHDRTEVGTMVWLNNQRSANLQCFSVDSLAILDFQLSIESSVTLLA